MKFRHYHSYFIKNILLYTLYKFNLQENPINPCAFCSVLWGPIIVPIKKSKIAATMMAIRKF